MKSSSTTQTRVARGLALWTLLAAAPPALAQSDTTTVQPQIKGAPGQGLTVRVSDAFSLNLRARIQLRYQLLLPHAEVDQARDPEQAVGIGTARIWLSGNVLAPELTYTLQLALAARDFREGAIGIPVELDPHGRRQRGKRIVDFAFRHADHLVHVQFDAMF